MDRVPNILESGRVTKFPPLPGGEGRGEGERQLTKSDNLRNLFNYVAFL